MHYGEIIYMIPHTEGGGFHMHMGRVKTMILYSWVQGGSHISKFKSYT